MGRSVDNNSPFRTLIPTYSASNTSLTIDNGLKIGDFGTIMDLSDSSVQQVEASLNGLSPFLKRL
jgi:hypothetical protein